ncbi:MAG: histidine phosphatase family protein [Promethearchaeota archaeon]
MPNNILIFLRHAETKINNEVIVSKWILTKKGKEEAKLLLKSAIFDNTELIITSNEEKAFETALPLVVRLNKPIIREKKLNEIVRDRGSLFATKEEYNRNIKLCMEKRNKSFNKWETANHALRRFSKKVRDIEKKYTKKKILIVSHGVVINLYFAKILRCLDFVFERWLSNSFCDYGIIQNGKVLKDIAKI